MDLCVKLSGGLDLLGITHHHLNRPDNPGSLAPPLTRRGLSTVVSLVVVVVIADVVPETDELQINSVLTM